MDSDALVCFQQNRRGGGDRRFKVYRVDVDASVDEFVGRLDDYVARETFRDGVTPPHWLDTDSAVMDARLADIGDKLVPFAGFHLFVVTRDGVRPFLAVPLAVDVIPALADGIRTREYAADDCDPETLAPAADATPTRTVDADAFGWPLTGDAAADGLLEWWHLFALRAGFRLLVGPRTGVVDTDGDAPTMRVRHGGDVVCVDVLDKTPLQRLCRDVVYLNYRVSDVAGADASLDDRVTDGLRRTARLRYRHARHLWAVRHGEHDDWLVDVDGRSAADRTLADERKTARARLFADLESTYGAALAPFSAGSYGAALRQATATRADTYELNEAPGFAAETVEAAVDDVDPNFTPDRRPQRF
ncbi:hypothetical protein [Halobaculum sp. P14]|uniref:hypothetical protein n=1 Tax=Halobaculum sp. P14 TaxID=3421638 RepID=UPI003EBD1C7E